MDAYCLQHEAYVKSAKSLAAHLCGLCVAFERGNEPAQLRRLQAWLSTNPKIERPALPVNRGPLTISSVYGIDDPVTFREAVRCGARSVWDAYRELQPVARGWLGMAG